ncbi:porin family protein [Pinibacter aurantiacus]|uniref:PorT family protein n=1 Tax=Pinibacter aurantiacus TaxID=2851599 RepID=A0A9E2S945_9BACT|nr:porin family protein [Pinibacter aurantiacus]MBV4356195.1 PorT family protein [Pinibacter aurantiacus]
MKRILVICSTLVLFSLGAKSQISYGVKVGFNASNVSNSDGKTLSGGHVGGLVNYALSKNFALQGEVLYSTQGCRYKAGEFGPFSLSLNSTLSYINIPILAQYYFTPGFYVEAGPQIGFLTSAKLDNYDPADNDGHAYKDYFKSTDFSGGIGLGYIFKKINLGIDARYTFGLSNIAKESDDKLHNKVFQLGVFYKFGKKK